MQMNIHFSTDFTIASHCTTLLILRICQIKLINLTQKENIKKYVRKFRKTYSYTTLSLMIIAYVKIFICVYGRLHCQQISIFLRIKLPIIITPKATKNFNKCSCSDLLSDSMLRKYSYAFSTLLRTDCRYFESF